MESESNTPWLHIEFLRKILKNDCDIGEEAKILHYKSEPAVNNGENYSSILYRVHVAYVVKNSTFNKSYIVKQLLDPKTDSGQNLKLLNVFKKEVTMYSEILPKIKQTLETVGYSTSLAPRLLYWSDKPVELLVLEDLKFNGFSTPDRRLGLDHKECKMALNKLALLHSVSMVFNKQNPEFRNVYNKGGFFENMPDYLSQFYMNGVKQSIEVMKNLPKCKKYVNAFDGYCENMVARGLKLLQPVPPDVEDYNVLCHGDFWLNNIMFKYDSEGTPVDVIFVDFQMTTFGNPGLDLNYFFFTSPTTQTRRGYREILLKQYVNVVVDVLNKLQYDGLVPCVDDLNRKLLEAKDIAIMTPGIVLPIVKLNRESSETITTESLMKCSESDVGSEMYNNPAYTEALEDAVQYLAEIGFIKDTHI